MTVQVNVRVEQSVKEKAEKACSEMGLNLSTAINIFLTKLGNERRTPFEVAADPFYSPENLARLKRSIQQLESGGGTVHELLEVE